MSIIIDLVWLLLKQLRKKSVLILLLVIILVVEIFVLAKWKNDALRQYFYNSDLVITDVEETERSDDIRNFRIRIANNGSKEMRRLPSVYVVNEDVKYYLSAVDAYSPIREASGDDYSYLPPSYTVPPKTEVTLDYYLYEDDIKGLQSVKELSFLISKYDTIDEKVYLLKY